MLIMIDSNNSDQKNSDSDQKPSETQKNAEKELKNEQNASEKQGLAKMIEELSRKAQKSAEHILHDAKQEANAEESTQPAPPQPTNAQHSAPAATPPQAPSEPNHPQHMHLSNVEDFEFTTLPVVPIREGVLFPSTESVLTFGRRLSINALKASVRSRKLVVLVSQRDPEVEDPNPEDLYQVGTLAYIEKTLKADDSINALVRGTGRVRILRYISTNPRLIAQVQKVEDSYEHSDELKALASHLQKEFRKAVHMGKPVEFLNFMKLMGGVTDGELADQIASTLSITTSEKQQILETLEVKDRLDMVIKHLAHEMKVLEIEKDVVHKTQAKFDKHMRENILRERLKTIQKELGDIEDEEEVVEEYEKKLKKLKLSDAIRSKIAKEIKRVRQMSPANPEAGYIRSWLDTVFELPWNETAKSVVSLDKAKAILEKNHYALDEVKDRILEYLAVLQLKQQHVKADKESKKTKDAKDADEVQEKGSTAVSMPTILCFVGPPGVGKTSIGRAIAEALGRTFVKVSLGGVRDEAEIRGHRRTYVGALPGKIINGIKQAGQRNPVFMLDEVDKLGSDYKGDPSSALLEALDPEQNSAFEDHYIDLPFDLSQVMFITTANTLDTIPHALRDRLEIIRYSGYTPEEKFQIAKRHLQSKVLAANGLTSSSIKIPNSVIHTIIERYTQEAGVRSLERMLSKITRKVARTILERSERRGKKATAKTAPSMTITKQSVKKYLGPEAFDVTLTEETDVVGQATGLAYTPMGGDVLFIEVALTPGKGDIKLTGKLGDVMKESAQAAMTYVKANATKLGIADEILKSTDVHVHVPEGAVPKEGPSAGVTMTTAIVSALTQTAVRKEVAMTGEVTLRGRVLRIGGLKEKSLAAHRAGSKTILIPKDNARDLVEIPDVIKKSIKFIPVETVDQVLQHALVAPLKPLKPTKPAYASSKTKD